MRIVDLVAPGDVAVGVRAAGKDRLLAALARLLAARCGLPADAVLAALLAREALGSTGIGRGLALPHARLPGLAAPCAVVLRPARPVAFDAVDGAPVDLACAVLGPEDDPDRTLAALAAAARALRDEATAARLRGARDAAALHAALADAPQAPAR